eukprot:4306718-Pyramimonas_sp.AAC.1
MLPLSRYSFNGKYYIIGIHDLFIYSHSYTCLEKCARPVGRNTVAITERFSNGGHHDHDERYSNGRNTAGST